VCWRQRDGDPSAVAFWLLLPDPPPRLRGFDVQGFVALTAALLAISVAATTGLRSGGTWSWGGSVAAALLFGWWFTSVERRSRTPLVDFAVILRPRVVVANVAVFFALSIMAGGMFLSVLYAQLLAGASPASPASLVVWSNLVAGVGLGLALPALIRVATESVPQERAGLGAGVYKTVNELGGVFGIVLVGTLLEARIVANALQQVPKQFLPQELSLNAITSLKTLEVHALQKGLAPGDLDAFHRVLSEAVQRLASSPDS
jgi:hypothetical protein